MTTTETARRQEALVFLDGKPCYELAAPVIRFSFSFRPGNHRLDVLTLMRPYDNRRLIQLLKDRAPYAKPAKDEADAVDFGRGPIDLDRKFFDEHHVAVLYKGSELTAEQLEKFDARFNLKTNVVNLGYNSIFVELEDGPPEDAPDLDAILADVRCQHLFRLADADGAEHRVELAHAFRQPTARDGLTYESATLVRQGQKQVRKAVHNYESLMTLYGSLVESLDGFVLGGAACTAANKGDWLPRVPLFFKLFALAQLFREVDRGNG